jgi:WD40 repeat protein
MVPLWTWQVMDNFITAAGCNVRMWDSKTGQPLKTFSDVTRAPIISLCLDDRQRKFFVGDANGRITCHNYLNGVEMKEFESHDSEVTCLLYVNEDKCLVSASWDRAVCIHDDMENDEVPPLSLSPSLPLSLSPSLPLPVFSFHSI